MSTRSVIARATSSGFTGVYHHWDGYPSGLGATLFELFNGHFKRDLSKMLGYLIDQHPAGWSTINGADFDLEPGYKTRGEAGCVKCGCPEWMHYTQYYASHGLPTPPSHDGKSYSVFNHGYEEPELPHGPECFCHGGRSEKAQVCTERNSQGCGCEWAYVFRKADGVPTMDILSSYHPEGGKMIGMFGCGNPDAKWYRVASVDLTANEPNWKAVENFEPVQPVLN